MDREFLEWWDVHKHEMFQSDSMGVREIAAAAWKASYAVKSIDLIRIETIFRKFRGAGDRKCHCHPSVLRLSGCQCGKQDALDLERMKLFAILDEIFPREAAGEASNPSDSAE